MSCAEPLQATAARKGNSSLDTTRLYRASSFSASSSGVSVDCSQGSLLPAFYLLLKRLRWDPCHPEDAAGKF